MGCLMMNEYRWEQCPNYIVYQNAVYAEFWEQSETWEQSESWYCSQEYSIYISAPIQDKKELKWHM